MKQEEGQQVQQAEQMIGYSPVYKNYDGKTSTTPNSSSGNVGAIGMSAGLLLMIAGLAVFMFTAVNKDRNFQMEVDKQVVNKMESNHLAVSKCVDEAFRK